ncbi:MAG: precorrin-2 C(20)-methyltransferase [Firmicutes bacterium]|nr:precorrin-2 C(20)-methyltransferase [Bacillota bacterium]
MPKGKFFGVSVGPGDPELLTLKAKRILEKCPVIAMPQTRGQNTLALDIVKRTLDISRKIVLPLKFLMSTDQAALAANHRRQAQHVTKQLDRGRDVAMVNIGDVSIYSTFAYINEIVKDLGYETEAIAGVPSFCAVAAALGISLTTMQEPLHIIPVGYGDFAGYLELKGTKVLMKAGSKLPEVKEILHKKGLNDKAMLVANCGLPAQRVYQNIEDAGAAEGYFATILLKE